MKETAVLFFTLLLLAGCTAETEPFSETEPVSGMISMYSDEVLEGESPASRTARESLSGEKKLVYTFEAWTCGPNSRCALHQTCEGTSTGAAIEVRLAPGNYNFLFWADLGKGCYNTDNLRKVTLNTGTETSSQAYSPGEQREAFAYAQQDVAWNGGNGLSANLVRPVAKLTVQNSTGLTEGGKNVSVTYTGIPTQYDVMTGMALQPLETIKHNFPQTTAGNKIIGEDFIFVPSKGSIGLTVQVGSVEKKLDALPVKKNHSTCVTATWNEK